MRRVALSMGLLVLALGAGCGSNPLAPSDVLGDWTGKDLGGHFAWLEIRFERQGSGIEGKACALDGLHLSYTDVPVILDGRRVSFRRVNAIGQSVTFRGEFDSDGTKIVGGWSNVRDTEVTLVRGGSYCAHAQALVPVLSH